MTRPKGTPNKKVTQQIAQEQSEEIVKSQYETFSPELQESRSYQSVKECLLLIVDALHDKDGDAATWKPIRDKIEAL